MNIKTCTEVLLSEVVIKNEIVEFKFSEVKQ